MGDETRSVTSDADDVVEDKVSEEMLDTEFDRAKTALEKLAKRPIDLLTVKSLGPDVDAVLIAKNISKLSPFVGTQVENAVVKALTEVAGAEGLGWARQDPGFPDAGLLYNGTQTGHGIEAKAWYTCSSEITARFKASQAVLLNKRVYVVLVAWILSEIVYGQPVIIDYTLVDAGDLAKTRDEHYHKPPKYLVVEPQDTTDRTSNLQQANTAGFRLQTTDESRIKPMRVLIGDRKEAPYTEWSRSMTNVLRQNLTYREETNFAKIDRIDHDDVEAFKAKVLASEYKGRTVREWSSLLYSLGQDKSDADLKAQAAALKIMREEVYSETTDSSSAGEAT